jgi:hypothetical protein
VIAAMTERAQANSVAVAGHLAVELGTQLGSALTRFHRLLRNPHIEDQQLTAQVLQLLGSGQRVLIALDWTEWHHHRRMLVAAAVVGCRAIPVQAAAFSKIDIPRSQNLRETTFLQLLVHTLWALDQAAVVLCDRGFRRTSWLRHGQLVRPSFVVRFIPDVLVHRGPGDRRPLRAWHFGPGQAVDLGWVLLRQDRAVRVSVGGLGPWTTGTLGACARYDRASPNWWPCTIAA